MVFNRFPTRAIRVRSVAPAEDFTTTGVTGAAPRSGTTTPCAPSTSALRTSAPKLCGSVMPSSSRSSSGSAPGVCGERRRGGQDRAQLGVGVLAGQRDHALMDRVARQLSHHLARPELEVDGAIARGHHQAIDLGRAIAVRDVDNRDLARARAKQLLDRADAEDDPLAHTAASTSATSASNALAGSAASRTGRPTTR